MSPLQAALRDYLLVRRQLGFELERDGRLLEEFVGFLEQAGATRISTELALAWAKLPQDAHPHRWRQRLGMVRRFARYLASIDPVSEVPPPDLLPARQPRVTPYIYSEQEVCALMEAAGALRPRLRSATYQTLIGCWPAAGYGSARRSGWTAEMSTSIMASLTFAAPSVAGSARWRCMRAPSMRCVATRHCEIDGAPRPRGHRFSSPDQGCR